MNGVVVLWERHESGADTWCGVEVGRGWFVVWLAELVVVELVVGCFLNEALGEVRWVLNVRSMLGIRGGCE